MDSEATKSTRDIYDEHNGDLNKVAEVLGLSITDLQSQLVPAPERAYRRRQPPADLGSDALRQFMISARYAEHPSWPLEDESKIEDARAKYEAGTHELCQGRDRNWFPLYCIPRQVRTGARKFFRTWE